METKGWHNRGYIPHFDAKGVVQHVVLCTKQALPQVFLDGLRNLDPADRRRRVDQALDTSHEGDVFNDLSCSAALEEQLLYFNGDRYDLLAWCIMPNHAYVVFCALDRQTLGQIVRSWKVLTTSTINRKLGTKGAIFAKDYFDRFMRSGTQTELAIFYVENNPVEAGLCEYPSNWRYSSAWHRSNGWQPRTENLPLSLPRI